jgi:hypothetical protein
MDEATGLPCLAVRPNPEIMGNWCGYVGVDQSHPFFATIRPQGIPCSSAALRTAWAISVGRCQPQYSLLVRGRPTSTDFITHLAEKSSVHFSSFAE